MLGPDAPCTADEAPRPIGSAAPSLKLPGALRRCLGTTNLLDSTHSGIRQRTRRVTHWQTGEIPLRWAAAALMETEKHYRRIMGHRSSGC